MFTGEVTVWYSVKSLENTLKFYTDQLGLDVRLHDPLGGMAVVCMMNDRRFLLGLSEAETVAPSTSPTVFEVRNIEAAKQQLEQNSVTFSGGIETIPELVKLATFTDPDGHQLMLSESLSGR